jgi:multidrug efflux pump subunit AcrA (membrane-fusion protein)
MSTDQPLDPQLVEQTKQQIRTLVAEIAQLAKSDMAPEEFYAAFLPRIVSALGAVGGAVWAFNSEKQLALQYQINLQETHLREREESLAQHNRLLYKVLSTGTDIMVSPHSGPGDVQDDQVANPTEYLVLLGLLKTDLENVGVVEVFQRADTGPTTQKGYMRFLSQMCELAGEFLKSHQLRHFSHRQTLWTQLEDFARVVHDSLDPRETAYTIANEGRRLIECDRVGVAIRKGKKCTVEAISGQDLFDKRSNTVRLLGKLASAVVASGDPMWYTGDTSDMPPQVEDAVQAYVDESHSKTVAVLPLKRPAPPEEDDPDKKEKPEEPIGALIVEQIEDSRVAASMTQRVEVVCRHSSTALANAKEHQDLFLMPVWRAIGKSRWVVQARTLPITISIAIAIVIVALVLCIWPAKFRLEAKGTLEPVLRQDVFAGIDGVVDELECDHGSMVTKGQELARLRSTESEVKLRELDGQRKAAHEKLLAAEASLFSGRITDSDKRDQLQGQRAVYEQQVKSYDDQLKLFKEKREDLSVKSPLNGEVVTWDLQRLLNRRPVARGQVLMRVADPDGPWQLELHMPENRMGHIIAAQKEFGETLEVPYILATEPGTTRYGKVKEIQRSAEVRGEEGNTVLIKVEIDKNEIPQLQPGATVTAKVDCGRRPLGYVLLHDVIAFIQTRILFKFF